MKLRDINHQPVTVHLNEMHAYIRKEVEEGCGPMFGLGQFVEGITDSQTHIVLYNLGVELVDDEYTLIEWINTYGDYIDSTHECSLEEMLRRVLTELITTGGLIK